MLRELQVFPGRSRKLPSLAYPKEELEQQLKEQARLNRYLRKAHPFEFESIPHDVFDVLKTDLTQPALQKKTAKTLSLFAVPQISIEKEQQPNVVNDQLSLDIDEYRAKRRRLMEPPPPPPPKPQEQVQTNVNAVIQQQQQQQQPSPKASQPQQTLATPPGTAAPAVVSQLTPAPTTTAAITTEAIQSRPVDTANDDIDTWYSQTDVLSSPTYTYPECWVPVFPSQRQIARCQEQSNIDSESPSQYVLAFDKILEYLDYPLNGEVGVDEDTINEHWNSSEKLKLLKGVMDKLADQDVCIAVLTPDNDGEGFINDLLEISGYECSRICNVIIDDSESDEDTVYGVVFYTDKSKVAVEFDNGVDVAFIMDPRIVRNNTKKNITTLRARHDRTQFARVCYLVTMGSVEERALKKILRNTTTKALTDHDVMNAILAHSRWPLDTDGANTHVTSNVISWLESQSRLDYTYRSKRKMPDSTLIEPVVIEEPPSTTTETATTTTTEAATTTTTTITTIAAAAAAEEEEVDVTTPVPPAGTAATATVTPAAEGEENDVSDMDVSSSDEDEAVKVPSDYIKAHIEKIFPDFTVNKTQPTNDEQAPASITELDKKVVDNLNQGLVQEYLKSANEAQERFEKEIKELKENYKKLALNKTMEMYH